MAAPSTDNLEWKFSQVFGEGRGSVEEVQEIDVLSCIEFDHSGDFIAVGDRGGRIVIFEREDKAEKNSKDKKKARSPEYKFYTEFQSHELEFDCLKSLEIEEKINKIKWCSRSNNAHFLLSTNDKTVKLWKVHEKKIKAVSSYNHNNKAGIKTARDLQIPTLDTRELVVAHSPRRVFSNAHAYHINSISLNSDGETYISSDDLRINLWNLGISDQSFNIVDIKPANMEELTEVITSAEFHPKSCHLFMYSSSKGTIKLADMRASALCDQHAKVFEETDTGSKSFFSEIISSISDIKFSKDGRYILSRDYMTLKVWDINMESRPVRTIQIHDNLKTKLCDLYENDCIFDKFECTMSHDGNLLMTGSYHNFFNIYDRNSKNEVQLEATKVASKIKKPTKMKGGLKKKSKDEISPDNIEFGKKILHAAWHPSDHLVAVGAANNLYLFHAN
eukprot:TRINITY_DN1504_c0_g1_i1.p1 TRINITY_DN1504_c0_g1~~TRINITY_DN1504_c0_g1_i1.p1  ORF type:complete len:447 (-),score=90.84 TRINITY_DN1504_c0_g1_i1:101-1441(-)